MNTRYGLSDTTWTCGLYHPNWFIYLFLAVFAFFSPFRYAKTAFSYSPDILSPCTPDLFMVKDVVKSKYRMIDMWSSFLGEKYISKSLIRQRRTTQKAAKKHTNCRMWSARQKTSETMWSGTGQITWSNYVVGAENHTPFLPPQVLYCNSSSSGCQGRFEIKPELKIWYAVNKEKTSSRSSPSSRR